MFYLPLIASPIPVVKQTTSFFINSPKERLDAKFIGIPLNKFCLGKNWNEILEISITFYQKVENNSMKTTFIKRLLNGVLSWKKYDLELILNENFEKTRLKCSLILSETLKIF